MTPPDTFSVAMLLARDVLGFVRGYELQAWLEDMHRDQVSASRELMLWEAFHARCEKFASLCKFNAKGVANAFEQRRRNALFGMIQLVSFQRQDDEIRELFQKSFGRVSLAWMMAVCGEKAPPWYYRWAFDAIPLSAKTFGPGALQKFSSPIFLEAFDELEIEKRKLLLVKKVMES